MVDDLLAGASAVPRRIDQMAADLGRAEPLPAHAQRREVPVLVGAGDAASCIIGASMASRAAQRRRPATVRATVDVDDVAMLIVTLARGIDLRVAIHAARMLQYR